MNSNNHAGGVQHDEPDFVTGVKLTLGGVAITAILVSLAFLLPLNSPPFLIALVVQLAVVMGILAGVASVFCGLFVLGVSGYLEGKRRLTSR